MIDLSKESPAARAARRDTFIVAWRARHYSTGDAEAVRMALESALGPEFRRWIAQHEQMIRSRHACEELDLSRLRARVRGISPMLVAACKADGLSVGAVAYGVLPSAHMPLPGDGHPWIDATAPPPTSSMHAATRLRMKDGGECRHYEDGAYVRPRSHAAGRFGARVSAEILHVDMETSGTEIRSFAHHWLVRVPREIPEAVQAAARGRPVKALIEHPFLMDPTFIITSVKYQPGRLDVRFRCEPIPMRIADLEPEPGLERQQLGRDGALDPDEAVRDLLERCHEALEPAREPVPPAAVRDLAVGHMRTLNMMTPPWGVKLRPPTLEEAVAVVERWPRRR